MTNPVSSERKSSFERSISFFADLSEEDVDAGEWKELCRSSNSDFRAVASRCQAWGSVDLKHFAKISVGLESGSRDLRTVSARCDAIVNVTGMVVCWF